METAPFRCGFCTRSTTTRHGVGRWEDLSLGEELSLLFLQMTTHLVSFTNTTPPLFFLPSPHTCPHRTELHPLNMDITGHFESASCVIEVDRSATLAQVKGKLVAELGVPHARHVGVRMRGGGDIGNDDLRICDTEMDEGCAVELYCTGANITPGLIPRSNSTFSLTLSPCDRYLAVMCHEKFLFVFDTETHKCLCSFPASLNCFAAFSACSEWISCVSKGTKCVHVRHVKTGALKHSFGGAGDWGRTTAWSPCGTKLLSWCTNKGLQVWDIATGVLVHEWSHIGGSAVVVTGYKVAMCDSCRVTIWNYTTGVEVLVLTCPENVTYVSLSPNQRFIAACCNKGVRVWNIETGECAFEDVSESFWTDVAVSNDVVAAYSSITLCAWSISTGKRLLCREFEDNSSCGLAISSCGGVVIHGMNDGVEIVDISRLS